MIMTISLRKVGGMYWLSLGRARFMFCKTKPAPKAATCKAPAVSFKHPPKRGRVKYIQPQILDRPYHTHDLDSPYHKSSPADWWGWYHQP